ncbi:hypothetical protein CDD83_3808 [Cordyceps sp. RAO-2017]|nr:hypothetical protein CDD83_3808 [Cordyceps sp. RAO-2017]
MPKIPPRPAHKRLDQAASSNFDRFAPSPLHGGIMNKANLQSPHHGQTEQPPDVIERSGSVSMPSVGEEGAEYSAVAEDLQQDERTSSSPEQTRTVADDLKLHAPKPSLPAASAKKQVMAVTRTDSERAASFGIGRPTSTTDERTASRNSNRKRPGSSFSAHSDHHTDDEHGIPEIGQRVPMNPHLGDVQAPSPGPSSGSEGPKKHHGRKNSARGLPPGSYGLHGHGVAPQDKLEKAYYQKHPDAMEREQHTPLHDRQNDFAMSSSDLNRLVRDSASRSSTFDPTELRGTPTEEIAFQASEEYTSRISSRPASAVFSDQVSPRPEATPTEAEGPIHVDDAKHPELYSCGGEDHVAQPEDEEYKAPILASDEVNKHPNAHVQFPAVHPHHERRDSLQEMEESSSRPSSRPSSTRAISYPHPEFGSTPLEDVEEYEPLFTEETKEEKPRHESADENDCRHHFPSKDIWEDAPSSVHYTATVSTPDVNDQERRRSSAYCEDRPITPARAFAQYQEQLAENEATGRPDAFLSPSAEKPSWISHQPHLSPKKLDKTSSSRRFPSRDVWEDVPESQLHEAVVSGSHAESDSQLTKKTSGSSDPPTIPERPKLRQASGDSVTKQKPPVSEKPKPHIPPRPAKASPGDTSSKDAPIAKPKPAVPSRPVGGKIAALQAGFMSDLNKRLQLGPQAPKKEDAAKEDEAVEEKEKVPLSDARKGRARGPQRRAPAKASTPAAAAAPPQTSAAAAPVLTFSMPQTSWAMDPDDGDIALGTENEATPDTVTEAEEYAEASTLEVVDPGVSKKPGVVEEPTVMAEPATVAEEHAQAADSGTPKAPARDDKEDKIGGSSKEQPVTKEKTLAANMAGESIVEATVREDHDASDVKPLDVHDDVKG